MTVSVSGAGAPSSRDRTEAPAASVPAGPLLITLSGGSGAGKTTIAAELAALWTTGPLDATGAGTGREASAGAAIPAAGWGPGAAPVVLHTDVYFHTDPAHGVWSPDENGVPRLDVGERDSMDAARLGRDVDVLFAWPPAGEGGPAGPGAAAVPHGPPDPRAPHEPSYEPPSGAGSAPASRPAPASPSPSVLVIVEGMFAFGVAAPGGVPRFDVYVDVPADLRLVRKIERKCLRGGFPLDVLLRNYPARRASHERHVAPVRERCAAVLDGRRPAADLAGEVAAALAAASAASHAR